MSTSVLVTADFFIKPERASEFVELLRGALNDTRSYEGCTQVETFVDRDDPGHVLLLMRWAERAAHERYLAWRAEQGMPEMLAEFISAPPEFRYLDERPGV